MNPADLPALAAYTAPATLLAEHVVAITGAGDGIGRAVALACGTVGATVILMGRTTRKLEATYDELLALDAPEPAIYPVELSGATATDYAELGETIESTFGRLDGLVHSAATLGAPSPIELYDPNQWQDVMQVNVNAAFLLTRALLPQLKAAPAGSIIFTTADLGRRPRAYWGAYAISKFALEGLTQLLADELDAVTTVRVNALNPGPVRTRLRANAYPGENPQSLPAPADVANAYLYLLGTDASGITGQSLDAQIMSC